MGMKFDDLLMEERPDVQKVRSSYPSPALHVHRSYAQVERGVRNGESGSSGLGQACATAEPHREPNQ